MDLCHGHFFEQASDSVGEDSHAALEANHRIANHLQLVGTFLLLQEREVADVAAKHALKAAAARVAAVGGVQRALLRGKGDTVELRAFLGSICADMRVVTGLTISTAIDNVAVSAEVARDIAIVVSELIVNAAKYAYGDRGGDVAVSCQETNGGFLSLSVADRGPGMPDGFRSEEAASGVGMTILRGAARQLGGELTFSPGRGVSANVLFPFSASAPEDRISV